MNRKLLGLKNRYSFYIEICIYMVFFYAISACVYLNGDDFMYATFAKDGIFRNVSWYYLNRNGRFWINVLDSALLSFDRVLFIILNPIVIMAFIVLLAKNIQLLAEGASDKVKERRYIRYGMVMFACLDVMCLRETVFWITGMMNYLFPATVFLFATWSFLKIRANPSATLCSKIGYFVLCMLASSSVEQFALMFVGFCTLFMAGDIFRKQKISANLIIGYIVAIIALGILILAPGNFTRVEEQSKTPLYDDIWTVIYQNVGSFVAFPFVLMLSICCYARIYSLKGKRWGFIASLIPIGYTIVNIVPCFNKAVIQIPLFLMLAFEIGFVAINNSMEERIKLITLLAVGIGSQLMLVISDVWGYRCMFSMYVIYMLLIGLWLNFLPERKRIWVLLSGIIGSVQPLALFALLIVMFIKESKITNLIVKVSIPLVTVYSFFVLFMGYLSNVETHKINISNAKGFESYGKILVNEMQEDVYSWFYIEMPELHEEYYRRYYEIPQDINFIYIEK